MSAKPPVPGTYQHYKGALYEVLGIADEPETGKQYVVYQSLGVMHNQLPADPKNEFYPEPGVTGTPTKGELAVCSIARFTEEVDGKEYSGGRRVPRFRLVSPAPRR
ncbi:MAG: DUF1653 domain-containing protein [Zavarzinella sp.]|nr:DUF1653 domain-containing protein [Zavarzinella sp.]